MEDSRDSMGSRTTEYSPLEEKSSEEETDYESESDIISDSWIIGFVPGGQIKSIHHLLSILKKIFPLSILDVIKKGKYFGNKTEVVKMKIPIKMEYESLRNRLSEWNFYLVYYL